MGKFELNKKDSERLDQYIKELREQQVKVADAVSAYNAELEQLREPIDAAIDDYNRILEEVEAFVEDIRGPAREYFDGRSEKWQDDEAGQNASQWLDEWEGFEAEQIGVDYPEELDTPGMDHADKLEALPSDADA